MAFNAPDVIPNLQDHRKQDCHDKVNHRYPQPCSSRWNCRLNLANPNGRGENSLSLDANPAHFDSTPCRNRTDHRADEVRARDARVMARAEARARARAASGEEEDAPPGEEDTPRVDTYTTTADERSSGEGEGNSTEDDADELKGIFNVCRYCIASTESKPWFKLARKHFVEKPPQRKDTLPHKHSRYFLTRLCRLCEAREEQLLDELQNPQHHILPVNRQSPREQRLMTRYPNNRCRCQRTTLYVGVRCDTHRRVMWDSLKTDVLAQKAANMQFLVNSEQNDQGQRVQSTVETQMRRNHEGLWRACRCGADPVATPEEAVVMQCMGCEGIVHFPPNAGLQPAVAAENQLRENSMSAPRLFALA
jgi:hypothetical protein